jgi:hypothetical protein
MKSILLALLFASSAFATTKGLNQIVTPDIQPQGQATISLQRQHPSIGNANQMQIEVGLTSQIEAALFHGTQPDQTTLHAEMGLMQMTPFLLSVGFSNWSIGPNLNQSPQPYVVAGFYFGQHKFVAGAIRAAGETQKILGYAYQANSRLALQTDYQSGSGNSLTFGLNYNITPQLSLNPALYRTNDNHNLLGYAVLAYTLKGF